MTPETYAKIVAKRPELAVRELLLGEMRWSKGAWRWSRGHVPLFDRAALALIESHWMRMMPNGSHLVRSVIDGRFMVGRGRVGSKWHDSPLDALAEFYGGNE